MADVMQADNMEKEKISTEEEVKQILNQLESDFPGITEGIAALLGSSTGFAGSLGALYILGTTGFSAAGVTSGLAAAGSFIGGGMLAGVGVLAAPVAVLGIAFYSIAKKRKEAKMAVALGQAIKKLYEIQERLLKNAEFYKEDIAAIKAAIAVLQRKASVKGLLSYER